MSPPSFQHCTDLSSDERIQYLEAKHGIVGYSILLKLQEKLHRAGVIEWNENEERALSAKTHVSSHIIRGIIETCISENILIRSGGMLNMGSTSKNERCLYG